MLDVVHGFGNFEHSWHFESDSTWRLMIFVTWQSFIIMFFLILLLWKITIFSVSIGNYHLFSRSKIIFLVKRVSVIFFCNQTLESDTCFKKNILLYTIHAPWQLLIKVVATMVSLMKIESKRHNNYIDIWYAELRWVERHLICRVAMGRYLLDTGASGKLPGHLNPVERKCNHQM